MARSLRDLISLGNVTLADVQSPRRPFPEEAAYGQAIDPAAEGFPLNYPGGPENSMGPDVLIEPGLRGPMAPYNGSMAPPRVGPVDLGASVGALAPYAAYADDIEGGIVAPGLRKIETKPRSGPNTAKDAATDAAGAAAAMRGEDGAGAQASVAGWFDDNDRYMAGWKPIEDPLGTIKEASMGGRVRAVLENMGMDTDTARRGEQVAGGLTYGGAGVLAFLAMKGLMAPDDQSPGQLPMY
jgi:hypothetical protein